jgi:hypothetical protein
MYCTLIVHEGRCTSVILLGGPIRTSEKDYGDFSTFSTGVNHEAHIYQSLLARMVIHRDITLSVAVLFDTIKFMLSFNTMKRWLSLLMVIGTAEPLKLSLQNKPRRHGLIKRLAKRRRD